MEHSAVSAAGRRQGWSVSGRSTTCSASFPLSLGARWSSGKARRPFARWPSRC